MSNRGATRAVYLLSTVALSRKRRTSPERFGGVIVCADGYNRSMDHSEREREPPSWTKIILCFVLASEFLLIGRGDFGKTPPSEALIAGGVLLFISGYWLYRLIRDRSKQPPDAP